MMFVEPCLLCSSEVMLVSNNVQFFIAQSYSKCFSVVHALVIRDCSTMISSCVIQTFEQAVFDMNLSMNDMGKTD